VDLIRERGRITTADLAAAGYEHPPRAIADVREAGIPIRKTMGVNPETGKRMAIYTFGDPADIRAGRFGGRLVLPKKLKSELATRDGVRCSICAHPYELNDLTIDHRVPYRIGGEPRDHAGFMLVCRACQRAKSWCCEHCPNWASADAAVCASCAWAYPAKHEHVATVPQRQVIVTFRGDEEMRLIEEMERRASSHDSTLADYIKTQLKTGLAPF
jgi:hypothetical protein